MVGSPTFHRKVGWLFITATGVSPKRLNRTETTPEYTAWLHKQVADAKADVLCVQEITNQGKVNFFMADNTILNRQKISKWVCCALAIAVG